VAAIGVTRRTTLPRQLKLPGPGALCRAPLGTNDGRCLRGVIPRPSICPRSGG